MKRHCLLKGRGYYCKFSIVWMTKVTCVNHRVYLHLQLGSRWGQTLWYRLQSNCPFIYFFLASYSLGSILDCKMGWNIVWEGSTLTFMELHFHKVHEKIHAEDAMIEYYLRYNCNQKNISWKFCNMKWKYVIYEWPLNKILKVWSKKQAKPIYQTFMKFAIVF